MSNKTNKSRIKIEKIDIKMQRLLLVFQFGIASLVGISLCISSSTARLKICIIIARIKKYKSIIEEKRKKQDNNISRGEFVSVNNVLNEYDDMKKQNKNILGQ